MDRGYRGLREFNCLLQNLLRGLCRDSQWIYAVYWKILPRNYPPPKWGMLQTGSPDRTKGNKRNWILVWEDGYCDFSSWSGGETYYTNALEDNVGCSDNAQSFTASFHPKLFFKMSHEVYSYGEGKIRFIGKVASDNSHKWVYKNPKSSESFSMSTWHGSLDPYPKTWEAHFNAGIQTVALVSVKDGLLQLGSFHEVVEDLNFVVNVKRRFNCLQNVPGGYASNQLSAPQYSYETVIRSIENIVDQNNMTGSFRLMGVADHRRRQEIEQRICPQPYDSTLINGRPWAPTREAPGLASLMLPNVQCPSMNIHKQLPMQRQDMAGCKRNSPEAEYAGSMIPSSTILEAGNHFHYPLIITSSTSCANSASAANVSPQAPSIALTEIHDHSDYILSTAYERKAIDICNHINDVIPRKLPRLSDQPLPKLQLAAAGIFMNRSPDLLPDSNPSALQALLSNVPSTISPATSTSNKIYSPCECTSQPLMQTTQTMNVFHDLVSKRKYYNDQEFSNVTEGAAGNMHTASPKLSTDNLVYPIKEYPTLDDCENVKKTGDSTELDTNTTSINSFTSELAAVGSSASMESPSSLLGCKNFTQEFKSPLQVIPGGLIDQAELGSNANNDAYYNLLLLS